MNETVATFHIHYLGRHFVAYRQLEDLIEIYESKGKGQEQELVLLFKNDPGGALIKTALGSIGYFAMREEGYEFMEQPIMTRHWLGTEFEEATGKLMKLLVQDLRI